MTLTDGSAWTLLLRGIRGLVESRDSIAAPATKLAAGQPMSFPLPPRALSDSGGVLMLIDPDRLRVHCVADRGGDPATGWSSTLG